MAKKEAAAKRYKNINTGQIVSPEGDDAKYAHNARWREIDKDGEFVVPVEQAAQSIAHPDPVVQARRERAAVKKLETARADETAPNPIGSVAASAPRIDPVEAKRRADYDYEHRVETDISDEARAAREAADEARDAQVAEQARIEQEEAERLREQNVRAAAAAEAEYKTTGVNPDVTDAIEAKKAALDDQLAPPAGPGGDKVDQALADVVPSGSTDEKQDGEVDGNLGVKNGDAARADQEKADAKAASDDDYPSGDPSDDWTVPQLKAYAKARTIELGGATVKADVLKAIKKGDKA